MNILASSFNVQKQELILGDLQSNNEDINLINYMSLKTVAIFLLPNLYLKQSISSEYVQVYVNYMSILYLLGTLTENYKMKIPCPQLDSNRDLLLTTRTR